MPPYLPVRAISRSQRVRIAQQTLKTGTTSYVDLGSQTETNGIKAGSPLPFSPFKELQNHLAIGAVIVVGGLTGTNSNEVIESGVITTAGVETVTVTSGILHNRNTGANVTVAGVTAEATAAAPGAGKYRIDLVEVNEETGAVKQVEGAATTEEKTAKVPATTAKYLAVATLLFKTTGKTPTVTEVAPRP